MKRKVQVFSGAYASGKSETAINRALFNLHSLGHKTTLVDLDTVEPAYCLRPIVKQLENMGLNIIAQKEYFGLGEAASYVTQEQINCLSSDSDIVIDVGYGASGLDILDIINNIEKESGLEINLVVNTSKFETMNFNNIIEYLNLAQGLNHQPWKKFSGLVSNTHFGNDTTKDDIINGYNILKEVSLSTGIPIIGIGADIKFKPDLQDKFDSVDIWYYQRMMPNALW